MCNYVTFYEYVDIDTEVTEILPPLLSYYRYVGTKGIGNGTLASITGGITIFDSGDETEVGDSLAAIQISESCPTDLSINNYTDAVQFGSNCDGAMRITVQGGGTVASQTAMVIQRRTAGIWKTIFKIK